MWGEGGEVTVGCTCGGVCFLFLFNSSFFLFLYIYIFIYLFLPRSCVIVRSAARAGSRARPRLQKRRRADARAKVTTQAQTLLLLLENHWETRETREDFPPFCWVPVWFKVQPCSGVSSLVIVTEDVFSRARNTQVERAPARARLQSKLEPLSCHAASPGYLCLQVSLHSFTCF